MAVTGTLRDHVRSNDPALILYPSNTEVSFAELDARANRLAHFLRRTGIGPGDTIAVLMENNEHVPAIMWAARRSGLYYTLINTHLSPGEVDYIVGDCEAKALLSSRAMRSVLEQLECTPDVALIADEDLPGWLQYPDCLADEPEHPIANELAGQLLQYSGGTTGRPKGIRRPPAGFTETTGISTPVFEALGVVQGSVYLSPAPLYHTAPAMWTLCAQSVGATTVVMEKFDPESALACIEKHRVTHAQFVPSMFVRMLRLPLEVRDAYCLHTLERVVHASAPCPPDIKREMLDWWGPIVDEYYGSSEGVGTSFIRAEDWLEHPGSVGRPMVGRPHILTEDGAEAGPGVVGDVYYEGGLPFEYLNDPAATLAARTARGWVTVGDVGYVDGDGYLYLTDRRHHMIISGGVNIYPQEAENVLISHPLVVDAAVFGIPDEVMGQSVKAVVQLTDPALADDALARELSVWTRERLAHYKCPRSISFERLPRTDAGKLNKNRLVAEHSK